MTIEIWLIYLITVVAFMSTPGPSHLLMLSNSLTNGFKRSTATAAGDLSANFLQMIAASLGLATIFLSSPHFFIILKWAGVLYLAYLGLRMLLSSPSDIGDSAIKSSKLLFWQGFVTSATNPKAILFFAALFPQFIVQEEALLPQLLTLSLTYLLVDGVFLCLYGKFAEVFREKVLNNYASTLNKLSGSLFLGAAIILGFKDFEPH